MVAVGYGVFLVFILERKAEVIRRIKIVKSEATATLARTGIHCVGSRINNRSIVSADETQLQFLRRHCADRIFYHNGKRADVLCLRRAIIMQAQ